MRNVMLFQVYDRIGHGLVGNIITAHHQAGAVRVFTDALNDRTTILGQHPDDFELLCLGLQDEETGTIDPYERPETIMTGEQWRFITDQRNADAAQADNGNSGLAGRGLPEMLGASHR